MGQTRLHFTICFWAFICFWQISNAQTPSWKWAQWSNGTQTTARSACTDASGNLYACGTFNTSTKFDTATLSSTGDAGFLVKYSSSGTYMWSRKIKNPGFAAVDCKSVAIDATGNLYISGAFSGTIELDSKTLTGGGHYVAKYDNNGTIQWAVKADGSNAVKADATGVFVAGGVVVQKFDASGTAAWNITGVKSNTGYTNFFSLALNSAGNLIAAGDIDDKWTFAGKLVTGGYQNIILMEVSSGGVVSWAKTFGANANGADHAQSITTDGIGNIIMTGAVGGATMFDGVSIAAKNGYLVRLSAAGIAQWGTAITNITTIYGTGGISVAADAERAVYVTGGYGTVDVTDGGTTVFTKGIKAGGNAFVFKFDSSGVFKTALTNYENPIINNSRGMALTANASGVYFAGVCAPSSEWGSLKVTGYGSVFAKIDGNVTGSINAFNQNNSIAVYPNPSKGSFMLDIKDENIKGNISITDMTGKVILTTTITNKLTILDLENFPAGIYILQLQNTSGTMTTKLMKE